MKQTLLLAILSFFLLETHAQKFSWVKEQPNSMFSAQLDQADNIYLTKYSGIISKSDSTGASVWTKSFQSSGQVAPIALTLDQYGNFYVSGYFSGSLQYGSVSMQGSNQNYNDIFLAKFNSKGNIIWAKHFTGGQFNSAAAVVADHTNIYLAGTFTDDLHLDNTTLTNKGENDVFITELDSAGNILWAKSAGGSGTDICSKMQISNDALYMAGTFEGSVDFGGTKLNGTSNINGYIWKLDKSGNSVWAIPALNCKIDAMCTDANNIYAGGYFVADNTFGGIQIHTDHTAGDGFMAKLNTDGTAQWIFTTKSKGFDDVSIDGVSLDNTGNCYIAGGFEGEADFNGKTLNSKGEFDGFVAQLSPRGTLKWVKTCGGPGEDFMNAALPSNNNAKVYIAGVLQDGPIYFDNIQLQGDFSGESFIGKMTGTFTGINEQLQTNNSFKIYPNPSTAAFTVAMTEPFKEATLNITDVTGKTVLSKNISGIDKVQIDELPVGTYTIRIISGQEVMTTRFISIR